jgi:hypothetical protein
MMPNGTFVRIYLWLADLHCQISSCSIYPTGGWEAIMNAQYSPYRPRLVLQDALQAAQEPTRLSERVTRPLLAGALALLVALDCRANLLRLSGTETFRAQALAGQGSECIISDAGRLADGVNKLQVHV